MKLELSGDVQINLMRINVYGKENYFLNLKKIIKNFKDHLQQIIKGRLTMPQNNKVKIKIL